MLTIANKKFSSNLIQGPLAGVSNAPFRRLLWQHSEPAFAYTEMISCKTLLHQSADFLKRFVSKNDNEKALCFQLSGSDPHELGMAVAKATQLGADLIDLNCGCPVKKIRTRGAGSSLLSQAGKLHHLIQAMKQHTTLPVSVKIRVDGMSGDGFNPDIIQAINDAGADFLTVHGRHWQEHYETTCRYEQIAYFVSRANMPVIGNGDVACLESLNKMLATGCAFAMIGRAGVGQPWLIQQLQLQQQGKAFVMPDILQVREMFLQHVAGLMQLFGREKFAILESRKLAKYYARQMSQRQEFCEAINACDALPMLTEICHRYFV